MKVLVGIWDKRANLYVHFATDQSEATAIRAFSDLVNADKNYISAHPEDYALDKLATINEETGVVTSETTPLVQAENLVKPLFD